MNRITKKRGSGGRLRLGLFMATVAACLFVPAAMASAAIDSYVTIEGSGSGTVVGTGSTPGTPPVNCTYASPSPATGTCETESGEGIGGLHFLAVKAEAAAGSEFAGWTIEEGSSECAALAETCSILKTGAAIKVKAVFKKPNAHIAIDGNGSGKVIGVEPTPGAPPIDCYWNGATQEYEEYEAGKGEVCDTEAQPAGPFTTVKVKAEPEPGSVFAGWTIEKAVAVSCPTFGECAVSLKEGEIKLKATFTLPPVALTVNSGGGTGTGQVNCQVLEGGSPVGSPDEPCEPEYEEGTELELSAAPDTGSELGTVSGTNSASGCTALPCTITLSEPSEVNAPFNVETFELTLEAIGEGTLSAECGGSPCSGSELEAIPYGTNVVVTAAPNSIAYLLGSLTGSGSAGGGSCSLGTETCTFSIEDDSEVVAEFVAGAIQATQSSNVHGEVPQTTTLESECHNVNLGKFKPNLQHNETYAHTCGLIVTSTGAESELKAADESGVDTGFLTQEPTYSYHLAEPLEAKATDNDGLGGNSGTGGTVAPLTGPLTLLEYGVPVNFDHVTLKFSQLIKQHDPLHTGEYSKTITLTLKQTA